MTLKSMTAFGIGEDSDQGIRYRCEIKTLNARFAEVNVRMPRFLSALEPEIVQKAKDALIRGKVDISFDIQLPASEAQLGRLNEGALKHYVDLIRHAARLASPGPGQDSPSPPSLAELLHFPGVIESRDADPQVVERHRKGMSGSLALALRSIQAARSNEGASLKGTLEDLLAIVTSNREALGKRADEFLAGLFQQYQKRVQTLLEKLALQDPSIRGRLDEDRLMAEVVILTDKTDIREEMDRLAIHEKEFQRLLIEGEDVGRKLDFLCQEMHREVNTMSSKLSSQDASPHTLTLKHTIERIRQQVQNVE